MAENLEGRAALVTGAASGMGRVMARALASAGASVAGLDVHAAGLDALAAESVFQGKLVKIVANIGNLSECQRAVADTVAVFGRLDVLINCAGVSMTPPRRRGRAAQSSSKRMRKVSCVSCL